MVWYHQFMIIPRLLQPNLKKSVQPGHVVVVYGPRRVGKTSLIEEFINNYEGKHLFLNADELVNREALEVQNASALASLVEGYDLLVVDEAQRVSNIGLNLKILVDTQPQLKIIATGSASFELANKISEPLTGRKTTLSLFPISFTEMFNHFGSHVAHTKLETMLIYGGYPQSVTAASAVKKATFLDELLGSYLYKDVLELESIRRSEKIVDLLRLIAFQIGQEVSIAELATNLSLNHQTVERYLDLLEKVFVIYRVAGFSRNLRKEISKNDRYYFFDLGVRNSLIQNFNKLSIRNDVGQLWENFIFTERIKHLHYNNQSVNRYFWRTYDKKEIDLVEEAKGKISGYEIKWKKSSVPQKTKLEFKAAYPGSSVEVINSKNFVTFIS